MHSFSASSIWRERLSFLVVGNVNEKVTYGELLGYSVRRRD